jgi:hypothetical protein
MRTRNVPQELDAVRDLGSPHRPLHALVHILAGQRCPIEWFGRYLAEPQMA